MRILYLVPGVMDAADASGEGELAKRRRQLTAWAPDGMEVDIRAARSGPRSIESFYDDYLCVPGMLATLAEDDETTDAIIIGCFDDPGIDVLREVTSKCAIVGPGGASLHVACLVGERPAVVTTAPLGSVRQLVRRHLGASFPAPVSELASLSVTELREDPARTLASVLSVGRRLCADGADVLVFGCMSLGFLDIDRECSVELGVPVVNPVKVALGIAATLVRAGLEASQVAYPRQLSIMGSRST